MVYVGLIKMKQINKIVSLCRLILLHGLGDTHAPFDKFAQTLSLPQTATLSLMASEELPFDLGSTWFPMHGPVEPDAADPDDYLEEGGLRELDPREQLQALSATVAQLSRCIDALCGLGWSPGLVFLLGYGQGANVALETLLARSQGQGRLGGIVCIADTLPGARIAAEAPIRTGPVSGGEGVAGVWAETPVLVIRGPGDEAVSAKEHEQREKMLAAAGLRPKVFVVEGKGHSMIGSKEEVKELVAFMAANITLRNIALERDPTLQEIH